jgi:hypothetical protein
MVLRRILAVLVVLLISVMACEDDPVSPPPDPDNEPTWWLEPDSMNLGILVLDPLTYELIGGRVDHYASCDTCDRGGLPFEVIYRPPLDFGSITFTYTHTGDTLLHATTVWNGWGEIQYPEDFLPPNEFEQLPWRFAPPIGVQYYINSGEREQWAAADTAWCRVSSLDVAGEFSKSDYRVGVYYYVAEHVTGGWDHDRWVIFMYTKP